MLADPSGFGAWSPLDGAGVDGGDGHAGRAEREAPHAGGDRVGPGGGIEQANGRAEVVLLIGGG